MDAFEASLGLLAYAHAHVTRPDDRSPGSTRASKRIYMLLLLTDEYRYSSYSTTGQHDCEMQMAWRITKASIRLDAFFINALPQRTASF
jgi:hypothetical protein